MKKSFHIMSFICVLFTMTSCVNGSKQTSLGEFNLKGNIASIRVITYEAESKFGDVIKGDVDYSGNYQYEFNKNKMTTTKTIFDRRGNIDNNDVYAYDNNSSSLTEVCTYDYDGDLEKKIIFEYIDGVLVYQNFYNAEGSLECKIEFEYDGRNITKGIYDQGYWINTWNGNKLKESVNYDKNDKITSKSLYTRNGKLSQIILEDYEISLVYNELDDIISYINAKPYDDITGFVFEVGESYSFEYEYDSHDNWVKRISYLGEAKKPHKIVERNIIYFD